MKCPKCGHENTDDCRFCVSCGAPLTENTSGKGNGGEQQQPPHIPVQPDYSSANAPYGRPYQKKQPSKFKQTLKAVCSVLLFVILMFVSQSCVMTGFMTSTMMNDGTVNAATAGLDFLTPEYIESMMNAVYENMVMILLISNLITLLVICLIFRLRRKKPTEEFALYFINPKRLVEFALLGTALNIFVSVTLSFLPLPESVVESFETQYSSLYGSNLGLEILTVALVGPILEEIIFRGIAMTRLEPVIGPRAAVILSAVIFGFAHGTPIAVGYAFFVGLILALIYERCHSILPTIVCHVFFNLTSYWLPEDNDTMVIVLYIVSIVLLVFLIYSTMVNYPRFDDILADTAGRIRADDPEGQRIIDECRRVRNAGGDNFAELQALSDEWEAYEQGKRKKEK